MKIFLLFLHISFFLTLPAFSQGFGQCALALKDDTGRVYSNLNCGALNIGQHQGLDRYQFTGSISVGAGHAPFEMLVQVNAQMKVSQLDLIIDGVKYYPSAADYLAKFRKSADQKKIEISIKITKNTASDTSTPGPKILSEGTIYIEAEIFPLPSSAAPRRR